MRYQRKPAIFAVTGTGLGRPAGRLCLFAASLTLVLLPLAQSASSAAEAIPTRSGPDQVQPDWLPLATPAATPRSSSRPPRTANERALADIRQRIDLIDARIAAERLAEHARSADQGSGLPGDTSLAGPGAAPALAVTTVDALRHDTAGPLLGSSDVVAFAPAGDRQRPATSPD